MIPETAKLEIEELSREELVALIYEMAKKISELEVEIAQFKQPPTTSQNSSQSPSRDFKSEKKKRTRSRKKGAKPGHEKQERQFSRKTEYRTGPTQASSEPQVNEVVDVSNLKRVRV